ncbi:uncharacterized protein LOC106131302 [Amyelois transitella]|uniref:uncharacterized protein LOC106131302 n=1 Tax=Amyelois transitella TaxID=680683 RepID=UPI00298FB441|nr:uncharacterized protein LOC106131302 [Amyelois transitella]
MNDLRGFLFLMLFGLPLVATVNLECRTHFKCLDATHFHICVDFGDGKLTAIETLKFACPSDMVCDENNNDECDFPRITTITQISTEAVFDEKIISSETPTIDHTTAHPNKITTSQERTIADKTSTENLSVKTSVSIPAQQSDFTKWYATITSRDISTTEEIEHINVKSTIAATKATINTEPFLSTMTYLYNSEIVSDPENTTIASTTQESIHSNVSTSHISTQTNVFVNISFDSLNNIVETTDMDANRHKTYEDESNTTQFSSVKPEITTEVTNISNFDSLTLVNLVYIENTTTTESSVQKDKYTQHEYNMSTNRLTKTTVMNSTNHSTEFEEFTYKIHPSTNEMSKKTNKTTESKENNLTQNYIATENVKYTRMATTTDPSLKTNSSNIKALVQWTTTISPDILLLTTHTNNEGYDSVITMDNMTSESRHTSQTKDFSKFTADKASENETTSTVNYFLSTIITGAVEKSLRSRNSQTFLTEATTDNSTEKKLYTEIISTTGLPNTSIEASIGKYNSDTVEYLKTVATTETTLNTYYLSDNVSPLPHTRTGATSTAGTTKKNIIQTAPQYLKVTELVIDKINTPLVSKAEQNTQSSISTLSESLPYTENPFHSIILPYITYTTDDSTTERNISTDTKKYTKSFFPKSTQYIESPITELHDTTDASTIKDSIIADKRNISHSSKSETYATTQMYSYFDLLKNNESYTHKIDSPNKNSTNNVVKHKNVLAEELVNNTKHYNIENFIKNNQTALQNASTVLSSEDMGSKNLNKSLATATGQNMAKEVHTYNKPNKYVTNSFDYINIYNSVGTTDTSVSYKSISQNKEHLVYFSIASINSTTEENLFTYFQSDNTMNYSSDVKYVVSTEESINKSEEKTENILKGTRENESLKAAREDSRLKEKMYLTDIKYNVTNSHMATNKTEATEKNLMIEYLTATDASYKNTTFTTLNNETVNQKVATEGNTTNQIPGNIQPKKITSLESSSHSIETSKSRNSVHSILNTTKIINNDKTNASTSSWVNVTQASYTATDITRYSTEIISGAVTDEIMKLPTAHHNTTISTKIKTSNQRNVSSIVDSTVSSGGINNTYVNKTVPIVVFKQDTKTEAYYLNSTDQSQLLHYKLINNTSVRHNKNVRKPEVEDEVTKISYEGVITTDSTVIYNKFIAYNSHTSKSGVTPKTIDNETRTLPKKEIFEFECMSEGRYSNIINDNYYYICVKNNASFVRFMFRCQNGYHVNKSTVKCELNKGDTEQNNFLSTLIPQSSSVLFTENITRRPETISQQVENTPEGHKTFQDLLEEQKSSNQTSKLEMSETIKNQPDDDMKQKSTTVNAITENNKESDDEEKDVNTSIEIMETTSEKIELNRQEIPNVEVFTNNMKKYNMKHDMPIIEIIQTSTTLAPPKGHVVTKASWNLDEANWNVSKSDSNIMKVTSAPLIPSILILYNPVSTTVNPSTTPSKTTRMAVTITTDKHESFVCPSNKSARYAENNDCRTFYICGGKSKPIVGICPIGTVFSDIRKQCTKNLSHCIRNNEFECTRGGRFRDIMTDINYYICVKNKEHFTRFKLRCQNGYHVNKISVKCERNIEKSSLSLYSSIESSEKSSVEIKKEQKRSTERHRGKRRSHSFKCVEEGKFPDPNNCQKYYVCSKKHDRLRKKRKRCRRGEVYQKDKHRCTSAQRYDYSCK